MFFVFSFSAYADVLLPLSTLRVQGVFHCWAYVVAYTLESRALSRDGIEIFIDVEKDLDYWVNYQRLKDVYFQKRRYSDKKDEHGNIVGIGSRLGVGFDFWQHAYQQGLFIYQSRLGANRQPLYSTTEGFQSSVTHLYSYPFEDTHWLDTDFLALASVESKLLDKDLRWSEAENLIHEGLRAHFKYDKIPSAVSDTTWLEATVSTKESLDKVLGADRMNIRFYDWISIVPFEREKKWTRDRLSGAWSYGLKREEYPSLIRESLDQGWPIGVTFADLAHITPVVGYASETKQDGRTKYKYAVVHGMGSPADVSWETEEFLLKDLTSLEGLYPALERRISPYPGRL